MKMFISVSALLLLAPLPVLAQHNSTERELIRLDQEWNEIGMRGDVAALERLLADEFLHVDGRGEVTTKDDRLAMKRAGQRDEPGGISDDYVVRVIDDVAVMTHRTKSADGIISQNTHTFIKRDGRWQMLALQSTRLTTISNIAEATLAEPTPKTPEISNEELREILVRGSALVLDTRPFQEYATSHIPGALNVAPKPGLPMSQYTSDVSEVGRLLDGERGRSIVLYCNGPFCGKSKRLADELMAAGYANVRRYQLGIPVWRALGGVTQIETAGVRYVIENDRTAVFIDARDHADFKAGSIPKAKSLPRNSVKEGKDVGEVKAAKDDGRLPMEDHNTRIIVFGKTAEQAKAVAEAIGKEAFHNVAFFAGTYAELTTSLPK